MAFVQFSKVSLAFGDRDILNGVTLNLASGSKAALAGANGSGKTTLMKVLAGQLPCDSGDRAIQKETRVSYLPQSGIVLSGRSLRDEIEAAFKRGYALEARLITIGEELALCGADQAESARTGRLLEEHHSIQQQLEDSQWHRRWAHAAQTLTGLGFSETDFDRMTGEFSGGWQMRIALAKILLEHPDILLLDEPTNYLDLEARSWLEQWLADFSGGFLIVSHDRYFLDTSVTEVYELCDGVLTRYPGNYSNYEQVRSVALESLIKRYDAQQEEIAKTEDFIRRFRYNASKAAMVQDRIKRLEKLERIEIPESLKKIHFTFPSAPHTGRLVLTTSCLSRSYGGRTVLSQLDLVLEKNERLVVVGRNGAGKSTLLRVLAGADTDYTGSITPGAGVSAGYFSQDNAELLTGPERIIDLLESEATLDMIPRLRDMLAAFLFRGDDVYKPVTVLSGGEKSRLALVRLLLKPLNLLILDEPTNHLDLHAKDVLLDALRRFTGTVIFVSHDRSFIEGLATRVLELTAGLPGQPSFVRNFPGDYAYYLDRIQNEAGQDTDQQACAGSRTVAPVAVSLGKLSYEEDKRLKAERRKKEREEERLVCELAEIESQIRDLDALLCDPVVYSDPKASRTVQKDLELLRAKATVVTEQWEQAATALQ